jgi:hypothetical protein
MSANEKLKFGKGNAKLGKNVYTFSLPSGFTCPGANECLSKADRLTGKIKDGPATVYRCFSASQESLLPLVRAARWYNFDLLRKAKTTTAMRKLILASLTEKATHVRIHVAGDFYNQDYFNAWLSVAMHRPQTIFYFYTKNIPVWVAAIRLVGNGYNSENSHVNNFVPTASVGSKYDSLIVKHSLRYARVVYSVSEAATLGLEIDHDDSHAIQFGPSFGLLIHGVQPAGSEAAKALQLLKKQGEYGYGERADKRRVALKTV